MSGCLSDGPIFGGSKRFSYRRLSPQAVDIASETLFIGERGRPWRRRVWSLGHGVGGTRGEVATVDWGGWREVAGRRWRVVGVWRLRRGGSKMGGWVVGR